jgi:hypothetical protein
MRIALVTHYFPAHRAYVPAAVCNATERRLGVPYSLWYLPQLVAYVDDARRTALHAPIAAYAATRWSWERLCGALAELPQRCASR